MSIIELHFNFHLVSIIITTQVQGILHSKFTYSNLYVHYLYQEGKKEKKNEKVHE
jgi:hypothetical protein